MAQEDVIKDGYTRVSEILSLFVSYIHIDSKILKRKCQIGTDVHKAIECHMRDEFFPLDDASAGYFNSFENWYHDIRPEVISIEQRLYGKSMPITGCIDCMAKIGKEAPIILDFKTSYVANEEAWKLQGWFYWLLAEENGITLDKEVQFIKLDKKGGPPEVFKFEFTEDSKDICSSAYKMFEHFKLCKNPLVKV